MKRSSWAQPTSGLPSLVLLVALAACSEETPGDSLQTSVQAVSVSPTTVYPTPATSPSPSPGSSTGAIARWCEDLAESAGDQDRALDIYRAGADLPDPALAAAAEVLASGMPANEALAAGRQVERSCHEKGVELTG